MTSPPANDANLQARLQAALGQAYVLERELGGGGMSRVFVAKETGVGRTVVIKVLAPELASEMMAERFRREIQLAASLNHPHIVPLLGAGEAAGSLYFTMPFIEGESLRGRIAREGALPIADALRIVRDVAAALAYAHERGVVHRDIKPDNVLLQGQYALVTDFGVAKAVAAAAGASTNQGTGAGLTVMGMALGTPAYMAPEQVAADPGTDHRADIYALGTMAYELLVGGPPFAHKTPQMMLAAQIAERPAPLAERRPDVPPEVAAIVMRALEKDPDARWQTAAEMHDRLSGVAATTGSMRVLSSGTGGALTDQGPAGADRRPGRRRVAIIAGLAAALAAAFAGAWVTRAVRRPAGMDESLIAVAPFETRGPGLEVWHEGLVDVLSRSLDGAGPLRTVAPSVSIRRWSGSADRASAAALAKATGARYVLFGSLTAIPGDSVRVRASLLDARRNAIVGEPDLRDVAAGIDRLTDSLALRVLRDLGRGGSGIRLSSVGSRSLPALKAFLQGEQFYRRAFSDSAKRSYEQAVELDSAFALVWRGLATLEIRRGGEGSAQARQSIERALRFKRGLSPRDSIVLTADSLRAAMSRDPTVAEPTVRLLVATLTEAVRRDPADAELWFELGDAWYHYGHYVSATPEQALDAFDRAITSDSTFFVPYFHATELALQTGRWQAARRYARIGLVLNPTHPAATLFRSVALATDSASAGSTRGDFSPAMKALLDTGQITYLGYGVTLLSRWPDSAQTALRMARRMVAEPPPQRTAADSAWLRYGAMIALTARGHIREALRNWRDTLPSTLVVDLARYGAVPPESADARAAILRRKNPLRTLVALDWWYQRGDTASLGAVVRAAEDTLRALKPVTPAESATVRYAVIARGAAQGLMALARRDSAGALRQFQTIPDSLCGGRSCSGLRVSQLLEAAGRREEAARVLDRWLPVMIPQPFEYVPSLLVRARMAERLGDRETAIRHYEFVRAAWSEGDEDARKYAREAAAGLERLTGDRGRAVEVK
ncbi:MAG TPA: protein kinase [Gemmatimonadaceae bacterium]|nr:protein kinase [Gemmatimonadaceae bacterium]